MYLSRALTASVVRETPARSSKWGWAAELFSFPVMCMFLLAGVIFRCAVQGIAEPDIWWHMRDARTLLEQHSFSPVDTYSFTAAGSHWINFEWLAEVPFYLGFHSMGLQGLLLVYFAVLVLIFAGVYYRCCRSGADCKDAAIATLGAICLGGVSIAPRTLLFGWLCMVGLLLVLDHFRNTGTGLWLLPPLFALWINFHGSWVFGMVVFGIVIAGGLVEGEWGQVVASRWTSGELRRLLLAFAASIAAVFVNPFGYKLVLYPFDLLFRPQGVVQFIDEWQPVDFSTWNGKLALILVFGLFALLLFCKRRWRLEEVLLTAFALWAAISHVRFLFFAGLIIAPILAPALTFFPPYNRDLDKPWLNAAIIAALVGAIVVSFPSASQLKHNVDTIYPRAALEFMQRQHIQGRLFNQYGWGGYLEWYAPEYKTFIDGRADIFLYNGVFQDFFAATALSHSEEILDKYNIQYVLLPLKEPLTYFLQHSSSWHTIYSDSVAVLLQRNQANVMSEGGIGLSN